MGLPVRAALLLFACAAPLASQSALERSPNVEGVWAGAPGTLHFHFLHRFTVADPPVRKVINSPTFLVAAGLPGNLLAGGRYGSNSPVVAGAPNEWELFGRWALVRGSAPVDVAVQGGWNGTAESVDGELVAGRSFGPMRLLAGARAFSRFRGEGSAAAWVAGGRLRLHRFVALAGDAARVVGTDAPDLAWSAGLQLEIPYTPHSLSLHASNAPTTTTQGATIGQDQRRWGFEFTVPLTLSRYFGGAARPRAAAPAGSAGSAGVAGGPRAGGAAQEVVVEMNNRLQFLPDTVRIRAGDAVVWRNGSALVHTVTADPSRAVSPDNVRLPSGATPFDSGDIVPGDEFRQVFDVAGEYVYFCVPHEMAGMKGVVIVEARPGGD